MKNQVDTALDLHYEDYQLVVNPAGIPEGAVTATLASDGFDFLEVKTATEFGVKMQKHRDF